MNDLNKDYGVFGDYGYTSQQLLFESNSVNEAIKFAERYTRAGDMGGYNIIEVAFFSADGTYETTWTMQDEGQIHDEF
jgi:hypothetical protein